MSDKEDISRRKLLTTSGALGSSLVAMPAVAAGRRRTRNRDHGSGNLSEEEIEKAFATLDAEPKAHSDSVTSQGSSPEMPDDLNIYVGEHKNAEVPGDKPYAAESYEEYFAREAPPGFEPAFDQSSSQNVEAAATLIDDLYLQKDIGSFTLEGVEFTYGAGAGIKIHTNPSVGVSASLLADIYVRTRDQSFSFALSSFTVGYEARENGFCSDLSFKHTYLRKVGLEVCLTGFITNNDGDDDLKLVFSPTIRTCADPCPGFSCSYCIPVSGTFTHEFDNPL